MKQVTSLQKGVLFMVIASFCFALTGAAARKLGDHLSAVELVLFRNLIGVVFVLVTLTRRPLVQVGGKMGLLIFRGIIGTLALFLFFFAITRIGLAEAITYQQSYPIFLALFSFYWLGERLLPRQWWAIVIGFAGICCIFIPQMSLDWKSGQQHLLGLMNAWMTALAYMSIRQLSGYYDNRAIILSFMLSGIVLPAFSLGLGPIPGWEAVFPSFTLPLFQDLPWILLLGGAALVGQVYLTKAFAHGKAGLISVAGYSNILFSVLFGWLLGDSIPGAMTWLGITLIVWSGVSVARKEGESEQDV
ncbi:MAG: DMT family transporter [Spirosomataceae bacterium]